MVNGVGCPSFCHQEEWRNSHCGCSQRLGGLSLPHLKRVVVKGATSKSTEKELKKTTVFPCVELLDTVRLLDLPRTGGI